MRTPRTRLTVNTSLDRQLVARLHEWRKTQTAEVPFGRALDACIRDFLDRQTVVQLDCSSDKGA